jgi:hypothetical protein
MRMAKPTAFFNHRPPTAAPRRAARRREAEARGPCISEPALSDRLGSPKEGKRMQRIVPKRIVDAAGDGSRRCWKRIYCTAWSRLGSCEAISCSARSFCCPALTCSAACRHRCSAALLPPTWLWRYMLALLTTQSMACARLHHLAPTSPPPPPSPPPHLNAAIASVALASAGLASASLTTARQPIAALPPPRPPLSSSPHSRPAHRP